MNTRGYKLSLALASVLATTMGVAQAPPGAPAFDPAKMRAEMAAYDKMPDTIGTGKYPALKETDPSLPDHVIYRPADLSKLRGEKLGVLAWGNGGCAADGAGARFHLSEIASHGYLAIASGTILSGPGAPPHAAPLVPTPGAPGPGEPGFKIPPPATQASSLSAAIDWALAENQRAGSPYFGRINPQWVAVSGWSCGGLQAVQIAADPRVHTVVMHNTGLFPKGASPMPELDLGKAPLEKLHTPILYILGGPTDIAYVNGMDDFHHIDRVAAMVVNTDVGHGGTFLQPNGGRASSVAVSWLDWQLKGDPIAAKRFIGADCGLCQDPSWQVERNAGMLSTGAGAASSSAWVDNPCPPPLPMPQVMAGGLDRLLKPGKTEGDPQAAFARPEVQEYLKATQERARTDWPNLCRYRAENTSLPHPVRTVFMGDSITEFWVQADPALFSNGVVGRGISGQTSPQMLLRFYQDVIELHPKTVHIMAGTNDLAGNTGPSSAQDLKNNIMAMVELARAQHIRVLLASIPPARAFPWKPGMHPASDIVALNQWLRSYAKASGSEYVDYHAVLADPDGGFQSALSNDGVHPNHDGYVKMRALVQKALAN